MDSADVDGLAFVCVPTMEGNGAPTTLGPQLTTASTRTRKLARQSQHNLSLRHGCLCLKEDDTLHGHCFGHVCLYGLWCFDEVV